MGRTKIEYANWSWNPLTGCTKGCSYCYARRMTERNLWGYDFTPRLHPERLVKHDNWKPGDRVFCVDMGDWLDDKMEKSWVEQVLRVIADNPEVTFLMLTKQPQNYDEKVYGYCEEYPCRVLGSGDYFPNLWHGATVTCQADADKRIPILLKSDAAVRWISVEPMLGPVDIVQACDFFLDNNDGGDNPAVDIPNWLHWVVCGGMSGPGRKPMDLAWPRKLRDDCKAAGVPYFFKQVDKKIPIPPDLMVREFPKSA